MSIDIISQEFEVLKELKEKYISGGLNNKQEFWHKITEITQLLVRTPTLRNEDYDHYKEEIDKIVSEVKDWQAERERYFIALKEQMSFNQSQIEAEIKEIEAVMGPDPDAGVPPEADDFELYLKTKRLLKRVKNIRPIEKETREQLAIHIQQLYDRLDAIQQLKKAERVEVSSGYLETIKIRIENEKNRLFETIATNTEKVYEQFFNNMEGIKEELSSNQMIKKHEDVAWKLWKRVKEEAKTKLADVYNENYQSISHQLDEFESNLNHISNPKDAFSKYKSIQESAIKTTMKRRQKDKLFKRFKKMWSDMQIKFESYHTEMEKKRKERELHLQREAEKKMRSIDEETRKLKDQLAMHKEAKTKLLADIKGSDSPTFIRKAEEVLNEQEYHITTIESKLKKITTDSERLKKRPVHPEGSKLT